MLGRHGNKRQRRRAIYATLAVLGFVMIIWHPWSSGTPQTPPGATYTPATDPQTILPSITPSSIPETPVTSGNVGIPLHYDASESSGAGGMATPSSSPDTTTTTGMGPVGPANPSVDYGASVDPRFQQDQKNPLKVTYSYSASASVLTDGQFLPVSVLPVGQLEFFASNVSGPICTMSVGGTVTSGSCVVANPSFASYQVVANYVTGGNTYVSPILTDDVKAFGTTTVASIHGGGSLGGLEFDANVTDSNGNAVTSGSVTMTISDTTQGWSYVVNGVVGGDGGKCECLQLYPD